MTLFRKPRKLAVVLCAVIGLPYFASSTARSQARHLSDMELLVQITECEGKGCLLGAAGSPIWSFRGAKGVGKFGTGNQLLTIEHLDPESIAVRRVDTSGPARGLTALYMGRITGQQIIGSVIYYDATHPEAPRTDAWSGIVEGSLERALQSQSSGLLPTSGRPLTLRECESKRCLSSNGSFPIIWTFPGRTGRGWLGDKERPVILEHLDAKLLIVRRIDGDALGGLTALYFGEIDGKRITGAALYYVRGNPTVAATDVWYGMIQDANALGEVAQASADGGKASPIAPNDYPPPPSSVPSSTGGKTYVVDVNGDWEGYYASAAIPTAIRIHTSGLSVSAELLRADLTPTGNVFLKGEFEPTGSRAQVQVINMSGIAALLGVSGGSWSAEELHLIDYDHVAIGEHSPFQRLTLPVYNDLPCAAYSTKFVQAQWAYMRAVVAQRAKDQPAAVCWTYVSAVQGNPQAAFYLAYFLHEGLGTPQDGGHAVQWAQKGAELGSERAAYMLEYAYSKGDGVQVDTARASYWHQRGEELKMQREKQAQADNTQSQNQARGLLELGAMGVIGAAILSEAVTPEPLCDYTNDSPKQKEAKLRTLNEQGKTCSPATGKTVTSY